MNAPSRRACVTLTIRLTLRIKGAGGTGAVAVVRDVRVNGAATAAPRSTRPRFSG
jgi:hypothetical protein